MKYSKKYCRHLRQLISEDELESVFRELKRLLRNSPKLDDAIMQSARWCDLNKQIRLGLLSYEQSEVGKNKIRNGLLALVKEVEKKASNPAINKEMAEQAHAVSQKIINNRNDIQPEVRGNIAGQRRQFTGSTPSRRSIIFLLILIPFLGTMTALWYDHDQQQQVESPLSLTVSLDDRTPDEALNKGFAGGKLILRYGVKVDTLALFREATFRDIPDKFRGEKVLLKFSADGFRGIDTLITLKTGTLSLPLSRDNTYAQEKEMTTDRSDPTNTDTSVAALDIKRPGDVPGR